MKLITSTIVTRVKNYLGIRTYFRNVSWNFHLMYNFLTCIFADSNKKNLKKILFPKPPKINKWFLGLKYRMFKQMKSYSNPYYRILSAGVIGIESFVSVFLKRSIGGGGKIAKWVSNNRKLCSEKEIYTVGFNVNFKFLWLD